jgi:cbb3-type cytochrome c oxidase subunit III
MRMKDTFIPGLLAGIMILVNGPAVAGDGKSVFSSNCASCHGNNGQGITGLAPALKGDAFVTGKLDDVMATVKNGRAGDQKHFKNMPIAMPAWDGKLSDPDIKSVVDYIRGELQK